MIGFSAQRLVVALLAGASILTAPSLVRTEPVRCLPPKSCNGPAQCCNFKHQRLFQFQMADARKMRDWFGDPCNTQGLAGSSGVLALGKAADKAQQESNDSSALGAHLTPEDVDFHKLSDLAATTDPDTCKSKFAPGYDQQTTCQEFIDAGHAHEAEHADFCDMLNHSGAARAEWGPAGGVKAQAESERRAHAEEYLTLVRGYEAARRRCLSARNKLTPDLDQKSKASVRKAYSSYVSGGGHSCDK